MTLRPSMSGVNLMQLERGRDLTFPIKAIKISFSTRTVTMTAERCTHSH